MSNATRKIDSNAHPYLGDPQQLERCRRPNAFRKYRIVEIPVFLQIANLTVNDCSHGTRILGSGAHEAAIDGVDNVPRR